MILAYFFAGDNSRVCLRGSGGYCVGGAICLAHGVGICFPDKTELTHMLQTLNPALDPTVAPQATVGRCTCNANGGPDILLLVRSPTLLGGQAWTSQRHSAPIRTALPEAKRA